MESDNLWFDELEPRHFDGGRNVRMCNRSFDVETAL